MPRIDHAAPTLPDRYTRRLLHLRAASRRFIRYDFKGCPGLLGQLKDGHLLAVEVKGPKGRIRPEQADFIERVRGFGGMAFVARNCRDVFDALT